ncbi:hypothetical protein ACFL1H_04165 [Nanoarchaeota archaeon]
MKDKYIIVVEDDSLQQSMAKEVLENPIIYSTYRDFELNFNREHEREKPDAVLTDLYFPTGFFYEEEKRHVEMRDEIVQILKNYINKYVKPSPIGAAANKVMELFNVDKIDDYIEIFKQDEIIKKFESDIRRGNEQFETRNQYLELLNVLEEQTPAYPIPSGIFVYRKCKENNVPCIIVTSAYHHGVEFQPFVNEVAGNYIDQLIDINGYKVKPWEEALYLVLNK